MKLIGSNWPALPAVADAVAEVQARWSQIWNPPQSNDVFSAAYALLLSTSPAVAIAFIMSLGTGQVIYSGFIPMLKMGIAIATGFVICKRGMFTPQGARGVSVITMNISLPCLIFSSMVTAFTSENIGAFGPLILTAALFIILGGMIGVVVKEFLWVPDDFQYGIVIMGAISNWGNLPTAIIQSMCARPPFNPDTDVELGIAYIAIFILMMQTVFFGLGVHKLCAWDFLPERKLSGPTGTLKQRWSRRYRRVRRLFRFSRDHESTSRAMEELGMAPVGSQIAHTGEKNLLHIDSGEFTKTETAAKSSQDGEESGEHTALPQFSNANKRAGPSGSKTQRSASFSSQIESIRRIPTQTAGLDAIDITPGPAMSLEDQTGQNPYPYHQPATPVPSTHGKRSLFRRILSLVANFVTPATIAVFISVPISVIQPLRALFTDTENWTGTRMPNAPDGNPPLGFLLDSARFLGQITIPAALVLLGASFARLEIPRKWSDAPLASMIAMTIGKMVIVPVFGIFFVIGTSKHTGLFPKEDRVRRFTAMLLSGTPASANQLVITQLYNPAGTAHTLAKYLLVQYVAMFILSSALDAIALDLVQY